MLQRGEASLTPPVVCGDARDVPPTLQIVSAAARATLAELGGKGASIAVSRDGVLECATGVGWRDAERGEPFERDEPCRIDSITKPLLAALVMQAVEAGVLDLDAPVQRYLPELGLSESATLAHLLAHRSGLRDYGDLSAYHDAVLATPSVPWSDAEFLQRTLRERPPRLGAGEGFLYSNVGYLLIRLLLERRYGGPLSAVMRERLFEPLGLRSARVAETLGDVERLPPSWTRQLGTGTALVNASPLYHPGWIAHRAVIATAAETAALLDAILDARLVSTASRDRMLQAHPVPGTHPPFTAPSYGLGLMIDRDSPFGAAVGHGGAGPGFSCAAFRFDDIGGARTTLVALANSDEAELGIPLVFAMAAALAPREQ